jgi:hypothetical protein
MNDRSVKNIKDLEFLLEQSLSGALDSLPPQFNLAGHRLHVSLHDKKSQRKKRHNASAGNWSPESGEIRVSFEPSAEAPGISARQIAKERVEEAKVQLPSGALCDLIRHLDRAESKPGYGFVALKWFRDAVLPAVRPEWADSDVRNGALREALDKRLVLTSKVPNPKSPEFPVTAIRVNRSLAETRAILGSPETAGVGFQPVEIRGEPISATILRERR